MEKVIDWSAWEKHAEGTDGCKENRTWRLWKLHYKEIGNLQWQQNLVVIQKQDDGGRHVLKYAGGTRDMLPKF